MRDGEGTTRKCKMLRGGKVGGKSGEFAFSFMCMQNETKSEKRNEGGGEVGQLIK